MGRASAGGSVVRQERVGTAEFSEKFSDISSREWRGDASSRNFIDFLAPN